MGARGNGDLPMLHPKAQETPKKALEVSLFTSECQACCGFCTWLQGKYCLLSCLTWECVKCQCSMSYSMMTLFSSVVGVKKFPKAWNVIISWKTWGVRPWLYVKIGKIGNVWLLPYAVLQSWLAAAIHYSGSWQILHKSSSSDQWLSSFAELLEWSNQTVSLVTQAEFVPPWRGRACVLTPSTTCHCFCQQPALWTAAGVQKATGKCLRFALVLSHSKSLEHVQVHGKLQALSAEQPVQLTWSETWIISVLNYFNPISHLCWRV